MVKDLKKNNFSKKIKSQEDDKNTQKISWVFSMAKNFDFWFIDVDWVKKWYFVHQKNQNWALDWDKVEWIVQDYNWRKEAIITKIILRADRALVWSIEITRDFAFVRLDNVLFKQDVFIPSQELYKWKKRLKNLDKVAIKIISWNKKNPEWKIVEVLWSKNTSWLDVIAILIEWAISYKFDDDTINEAKKLKFYQDDKRVDLTNNLIYTIDWDDAKDLDDAILVEKIWKNYKLIVSIADVAEYVKERSFLDKEAKKRWNSTYLVDRVIPMLPEELSNNLCSLNPDTKKLCLSCEILVDENWNTISKKVYESIISSKFRLTYKEVQYIIDGKLNIWDKLTFWWIISKELIWSIKTSWDLKNILSTKKQKTWIINFDFSEIKIIIDENKKPIDISKYQRYESMKIIEEFMILANETIWELFSKVPFLYRVHPLPNEDDIEKLRNTLNIFWFNLPFKTITPKILSTLLSQIKWNKNELLIQKLILRSLSKAIYSDENEWHFGLNLDYYSHFTSPIRRYSDLEIHRIIKEKIHNQLNPQRISHYKSILPGISKHISATEKNSQDVEYKVKDLFICKYYLDKIWSEFDWIISWTVESWFFVELENWVEWFVDISDISRKINKDKYVYLQENMKFEFSKELFFQVWDKIKIKIKNVELDKRRLNFDFIEKI